MTAQRIDEELRAEFAAIAAAAGCELLDAEFRGNVLRLVLDHPEGVKLEHCELVSKQISALLDVADFGRHRYTLEVTSPGLDRELYRPGDYERFLGERIRITWRAPRMARQRTAVGALQGYDPTVASVAVTDEATSEELVLRLDDVVRARLAPRF